MEKRSPNPYNAALFFGECQMSTRGLKFAAVLAAFLSAGFLSPGSVSAGDSLLKDLNGDSQVVFLGFGDSIAWGLGDGVKPGERVDVLPSTNGSGGYVARLGKWIGINVVNAGVRGEDLMGSGIFRFARVLAGSNADIIGVLEGANDSFSRPSQTEYEMAYLRMVNITLAAGRQPLLFTMPTPCCEHAWEGIYLAGANRAVRSISAWMGVPVVDLELAWKTSCENASACELFCFPDGLHPNTRGYDVLGQTAAAVLLGIDIFAENGARQLEQALGWPEGEVIVKPVLTEEGQ